MSINKIHTNIKAAVWQEIAQSEIDVSGIDRDRLNELVDLIIDTTMDQIDAQLEQPLDAEEEEDITAVIQTAVSQDILDDAKEDILWQGRPFLSMVQTYTITDERIIVKSGLVGKATENIELVRIQDVDYRQTFSERMLNAGDIFLKSQNPSRPYVTLRNVKDPEKVYEILRRAILNARKRHGFTYREEM